MSTTYPDYSHTNFPESVDNIGYMEDADRNVISSLTSYQQAISSGDEESAQAIIDANPTLLTKYIFNAEKYNVLADGIMALQTYFANRFEDVIKEIGKKLGIRSSKATGDDADSVNASSAYSITASENLFTKKPTYRTFALDKTKWKVQTANLLWYYDLEDSASMGGTAYPVADYDVEVTLSNEATVAQMKAWGRLMPSGYQTYNRIGTRVGIPAENITVLLKITPKK